VIEPVLPSPTPTIRAPSVPLEPLTLPPGLELIETNPDRLRNAASKVEPPRPPRPPRARAPLPPISDEPLVLVETRK
jgi:ribonuclease E